jgi:hypothetical protein
MPPKRVDTKAPPTTSIFLRLYCKGRRSKVKQVERDVSEAASAFVTAGFGESVYDFLDSDMVSHFERADNTSISEMLADFFFSSLVVNGQSKKWKRMSILGRILLGDMSTTLSDLIPTTTTDFMNAAKAASLNDLSSALDPWLTQADDDSVDSADLEQDVVAFLLASFLSCKHEVSMKQAGQLLDVVLLLLSRLTREGGSADTRNSLLIIGVVASHVSDRMDDVFDASTQCPLSSCYRMAQNDSEGIF